LNTSENLSLDDINWLYDRQNVHFTRALSRLTVHQHPFTHIESDQLFHPDFYGYVKSLAPPLDHLNVFADQPGVPKHYSRSRKSLFVKMTHDGHKQLYENIDDAKLRYQYVRLYKWFSEFARPRLMAQLGMSNVNTTHEEFAFVADFKGFELGPHTDISQKVMTVLLYMPDDYSIKDSGTKILVPKSEGILSKPHKTDDDFNVVKVTQFTPGNLFTFRRSDTSYHSVSPFNQDRARRFILYTALSA